MMGRVRGIVRVGGFVRNTCSAISALVTSLTGSSEPVHVLDPIMIQTRGVAPMLRLPAREVVIS
jgi:hypothetical protein